MCRALLLALAVLLLLLPALTSANQAHKQLSALSESTRTRALAGVVDADPLVWERARLTKGWVETAWPSGGWTVGVGVAS
jgi:hypothetical protein